MSWWQALRYFLREALVSIRRSLHVSLLAAITIAVSLGMAGVLLVLSRNARETVASWRAQARFVVFLADENHFESVASWLAEAPWVRQLERVSREAAREQFVQAFPGLAELLGPGHLATLPPSLELVLDEELIRESPSAFREWVNEVSSHPGVEAVDDDRDWIVQVERLFVLVRGLGWLLAGILLAASVFTIASVIRFTALLYREEVSVMRLIGATEFSIRGPFYVEGMLQGLGGALLAIGGLWAAHLLLGRTVAASTFLSALAGRFLGPAEVALMLACGVLAGLLGAILSLGREGLPGDAEELRQK